MTNTIIRYDRLYSRNEATILYHGPTEGATSLDNILRRLNGSKVGWGIQGQELVRPTAIEETIDLSAIPEAPLISGQTAKMYTIDLQQVLKDSVAERAYREFLFRFGEATQSQIAGVNLYNSLPVLVEAETKKEALKEWERLEEDLKIFEGRPDLMQAEVMIYLQGLFNLAAGTQPPKYVFELTKV